MSILDRFELTNWTQIAPKLHRRHKENPMLRGVKFICTFILHYIILATNSWALGLDRLWYSSFYLPLLRSESGTLICFIVGTQNLVGFFGESFQQAMCQSLPSIKRGWVGAGGLGGAVCKKGELKMEHPIVTWIINYCNVGYCKLDESGSYIVVVLFYIILFFSKRKAW